MGDEGRYEIPDDHNVLVATPNYVNVFSAESHSSHIECVSQWTKWGIKFKIVIVGRSFVQFARTQMCQVAVDSGFTHILWLDDDAIIEPYILPKFLSHGKDVVIAPYPMRKSPFEIGILSSTAFECNECGNEITFPQSMDAPILTEQVTCDKCGSKDIWRNYHKHHAYRNLTSLDLNQGLINVDGGGTHAQLLDVKALTERRGGKPPHPDEEFNKSHRSYPKELLEIHRMLNENIKSDSDKKLFDHFIGDMPDQSLTFYEEDCAGKSYFLMPKTGTEDMYWCYRAKCKGIEIYADTDVFADHVSFAPVITKNFTIQAEELVRSGGSGSGVNLTPVSRGGRENGQIFSDKDSNLV